MDFEIVDSSPLAMKIAERKTQARESTYPFEQLEVGQSFRIPMNKVNVKSLRTCVYQRNARNKGKAEWAFIQHRELGLIEVARLA